MLRVEDFVESGLYESSEEVIRDALRSLAQAHPGHRFNIAAARYERGEISVTKAGRLAGVSAEQKPDGPRGRSWTVRPSISLHLYPY